MTWLTEQEVADRYKLSTRTIKRLSERGDLPRPKKIGRSIRYRLADLLDWEASLA